MKGLHNGILPGAGRWKWDALAKSKKGVVKNFLAWRGMEAMKTAWDNRRRNVRWARILREGGQGWALDG